MWIHAEKTNKSAPSYQTAQPFKLDLMEIFYTSWYVVNVDTQKIVSLPFASQQEANERATVKYGENFWTNETPFAVWEGMDAIRHGFKIQKK